ncbi:hypothetical protein [Devosia sediminis]|uniref:Uncharacterized protein n=1 Tax=Devosia sediminis TaxID=2798801 RepID=A0A934IXF4_9HYPH|nr:hypothetical protein [Devosia sediminis]MBJ3784513.1 hypothetical protein [Devosia sediminis]
MIDSWETVAVIQASAANLRRTVAEAQAVIDRQAAETGRAYRQLGAARRQNRQLVAERTARHRAAILDYLTRH